MIGRTHCAGPCPSLSTSVDWFLLLLLQCRSMIQRDWSQEDSTSNKMRMHAMILLLLSTSMNADVDDDSSSVSIPDTS